MLRRLLARLRGESGQSLVELAITLPILILLLCGIIDYGWIITNQNAVDHCAREGARYAVVNSTGSGAVNSIKAYTVSLAPSSVQDSLTVRVTFSSPSNPSAGDVTVQVEGDVRVLTPIAGVFVEDQTVTLTSACTMKVE